MTATVTSSSEFKQALFPARLTELLGRAATLRKRWGLSDSGPLLTREGLIDLRGVVIKGKFDNGNLSWTDLRRANLQEANLQEANRHSKDRQGSNLAELLQAYLDRQGANLGGGNLQGSNLQGVNLWYANLRRANLQGANLQGADLRFANLHEANLHEANLGGAHINLSSLSGIILAGAAFENAPQVANDIIWMNNTLEWHLNHINNPSGSLLTAISGLDDRYPGAKISLVLQLKAGLDAAGFTPVRLSTVAEPLVDVLSRPPFNADATLSDWLTRIGAAWLASKRPVALTAETGARMAGVLVPYFISDPSRMLSQNGDFIALTDAVMRSGSSEGKSAVADAYRDYLRLPEMAPWAAFAVDGVCIPAEGVDLCDGDAPLILLPRGGLQPDGMPAADGAPVMVLSRDTFSGMLAGTPGGWQSYFLYRSPAADGCLAGAELPAPGALFRDRFPLFSASYRHAQQAGSFHRLLDVMMPGSSELKSMFVRATESRFPQITMTGAGRQLELASILGHTLEDVPAGDRRWGGLTRAHAAKVRQAYGLTKAGHAESARTFLGLATVFTRYSSSKVLGTEYESPEILRRYAYALMEEAVNLAPSVVSAADLSDWQNRLSGQEKAYTCTAVLSDTMASHALRHFPETFEALMPAAWW
jgi:uncharacterized protein YjbI with pentapeptide repeats